MQTLDNIFAHATQLSDKEFGILLSAMMREQKQREFVRLLRIIPPISVILE